MTNGRAYCKSSEVFCKPSNLKNLELKEINALARIGRYRPHDVQRMCKSMKTQSQQSLKSFQDVHCKPLISYRDREAIPADAVLPLSYCVRGVRAGEVV